MLTFEKLKNMNYKIKDLAKESYISKKRLSGRDLATYLNVEYGISYYGMWDNYGTDGIELVLVRPIEWIKREIAEDYWKRDEIQLEWYFWSKK